MYENYLVHHGRLGQKWGVQNGPPYPLTRNAVQKAYTGQKKKRGVLGYIQERKEKKAAEEEKEKARHDADKERVLREGTASEVLKYANEISNQELSNALNRIKWTNQLIDLSREEMSSGWKTIDQVMKKVGNVKDWAKVSLELYKTMDEAINILSKEQKKGK